MAKFLFACVAAGLMVAPALAQEPTGDVAAGQEAFKHCQSCHVVVNDQGETLAGRRSSAGPNLYGVVGKRAGDIEGYRSGKSMIEAGEKGLIWDEQSFVAYVQDPIGFLRNFLDDKKARAKMAFKLRNEQDAIDLYAFLASLAPAESGSAEN